MDRRWDLVVALMFVVLGGWFFWVAGAAYGTRTLDPLREGTVPRITAVMMMAGGLLIIVERLRRWPREGSIVEAIGETDEPGHPVSARRSLAVIALFVLYVAGWPHLGYLLATGLVLVIGLLAFGKRGWKQVGALSAGITIGLYLVFGVLFRLPLTWMPVGP